MYQSRPRQVVSLEAGASECEIKNTQETPTITPTEASSGSGTSDTKSFNPFFSAEDE